MKSTEQFSHRGKLLVDHQFYRKYICGICHEVVSEDNRRENPDLFCFTCQEQLKHLGNFIVGEVE